jgi:hypothetical protein
MAISQDLSGASITKGVVGTAALGAWFVGAGWLATGEGGATVLQPATKAAQTAANSSFVFMVRIIASLSHFMASLALGRRS